MKIAIFGLGYVGCVSMGCLAKNGHEVIGVDINQTKINLINQGKPTIIENEMDVLIENGWKAGKLCATNDFKTALANADVSIICVGTPASLKKHLDLTHIYNVAVNIGRGLPTNRFHVVAIRSTVLPGTNKRIGEIISKESGRKRSDDFEVVSNPEFLREGTAILDYYNPPFTAIGTDSRKAFEIMKAVYKDISGDIKQVSIKASEIIKLINNSYHALKVTFANEIGKICKFEGIDSHEVMRLFCLDTKLNLSSYYFKPGFAYGGSCLPKDLKALSLIAHDHYLKVPVIDAIDRSNELHKELLVAMILDKGLKNIGLLGLSFKPGTDDLRNSPLVDVAEILLGKGYNLRIYDKNVHISNLTGTNKEYIDSKIPHLSDLITNDLDSVISQSDLLVISQKEDGFKELLHRNPAKVIIDLVRLTEEMNYPGEYHGICW